MELCLLYWTVSLFRALSHKNISISESPEPNIVSSMYCSYVGDYKNNLSCASYLLQYEIIRWRWFRAGSRNMVIILTSLLALDLQNLASG